MFQFTHPGKGATSTRSIRAMFAIEFQFTHPGKGATSGLPYVKAIGKRFNSRTLGRVRRRALLRQAIVYPVSIHAPWEGCDYLIAYDLQEIDSVSIHAPWEGCDSTLISSSLRPACFNSRTLGRVRLHIVSLS